MQLNKLINAEKKEFDRSYVKFLQSHLSKEVLSKAMIYGSINGGKRIRPLITLAVAKLCGYSGSRHIILASVIEYIHTATLLHDDVVDNSKKRRGKKTANFRFGNSWYQIKSRFC